jgi:hypothetical protein
MWNTPAGQWIHRILKPHGIAIISSVMNFPIHDHPYDYWRFTPEAFKSILKPFSNSFVGFAGDKKFPHTVVGIGFKGETPSLSEFSNMYNNWQKKQKSSIKQLVKAVTPPILLPMLSIVFQINKFTKGRDRSAPTIIKSLDVGAFEVLVF